MQENTLRCRMVKGTQACKCIWTRLITTILNRQSVNFSGFCCDNSKWCRARFSGMILSSSNLAGNYIVSVLFLIWRKESFSDLALITVYHQVVPNGVLGSRGGESWPHTHGDLSKINEHDGDQDTDLNQYGSAPIIPPIRIGKKQEDEILPDDDTPEVVYEQDQKADSPNNTIPMEKHQDLLERRKQRYGFIKSNNYPCVRPVSASPIWLYFGLKSLDVNAILWQMSFSLAKTDLLNAGLS